MKKWVLLLLLLQPSFLVATTRYVHTTCTNAITTYNPTGGGGAGACTGGSATVYSSIDNALAANTTVAGDAIYIRSGAYAYQISSGTRTIPTGTSWSDAPLISAYPGETVTVLNVGLFASYIHYVIFQNLVIDPQDSSSINEAVYLSGVNHVRFIGCEIKNAYRQGVLLPHAGDDYNEFINCHVHNNGHIGNQDHGLYISGSNNLISGCVIHDNAGYGIQNWNGYPGETSDNNIFANNTIYNNGIAYPTAYSAGIIISHGTGTIIYNNMIYGNMRGLQVYSGFTNGKLYNNSIYNNTYQGIIIFSGASGTIVRNNISYGNGALEIENNDASSTLGNNLCDAIATGCTIAGNPLFTSGTNLHLQTGSPAIDATTFIPSEFSTDFDGTNRPQGTRWDIGADEFLAPPSSFTVTYPNTAESWLVGSVKTITWASVIEGGNNSQTFNATGSWTAPAGVTSVVVDAWGGGGGGGGNNTSSDGGGGGGGGAFVRETAAAVTPTSSYTVTVGTGGPGGVGAGAATAGGDSWFNTSGTVLAKGGAAGAPPVAGAGGIAGLGGAASASIGDTKFSGGNGGTGRDHTTGEGGGGGGSAGLTSAGGAGGVGAASPGPGGTAGTGSPGGASGGVGGSAGADGAAGNVPGAGGGGSGDTGTRAGGAGAAGRVTLSWDASPTVRIELSRNGGGAWEDLAASTPDDGSFDWTVAGATTTQGRIRVSSLAGGGETDTSDANFSIVDSGGGGTITVTSLDGQRFKKGSNVPFGWTLTNVTGNVRIDVSRDGGTTWETVVASTPANSLAQNWTAAIPASSNCKYKVTSLNDTNVSGTMSGSFRIGGSRILIGL